MKNLESNFKGMKLTRKISFALAALAMVSLSSCLKNTDAPVIDVAAVSVINASPGIIPFDFVLDNQLVNGGSFKFTNRLPYTTIYAGNRKFGIYKDATVDTIKTGSFNAVKGNYYSLYVVGQGSSPEFLFITDSLSGPASGKAQIRFLNLAVNAPAVNLNYGVDSTLFSNVNYKGHTAFVDIPGGKSYNFTVKATSGGELIGTENSVLIESGKIYSVWAKGIYNSTIDSLKTGIKTQINY